MIEPSVIKLKNKLNKNIENISATKIKRELRIKGKLKKHRK